MITHDQIRLLRIRAQRLTHQQDQVSPAQVLEAVCGVQAQEYPSALLAIRARGEHLTKAAIEQDRQRPTIARTWAMRGTLHLLSTQDARWLVPLYGPGAVSADQRRLAQLGWDEKRIALGLGILQKALEGEATLTRAEIIALLKQNGLPSEGQAPIHLIFRAAMEGILCQGPDRGKQPAYGSFEHWVGPLQPLPRDEALARLARSYLAAYAPASLADFVAWSGIKISDARLGWQAVEAEAEAFNSPNGTVWLLKAQLPWLAEPTPQEALVRLLPRYDTYLLGYAKRDILYDPAYVRRINAGGGTIHPTIMVNGRILGTWKTNRQARKLEIIAAPFEDLSKSLIPQIENEADRIFRFLGVEGSVSFEKPVR